MDGYIAVSQAVKVAAIGRGETGSARLAVIPSGIRLPAPDAVARARASREQAKRPLVASAGRLETERRFDVLLRAMPGVLKRLPECRFVIAGSGSAEGGLKRLAARLGVEHALTWTGWLKSIDPVLTESHVYVNPWPWEGFGMATAEAIAFGLPVIAVRSGASIELVEDGVTGRVVAPEDPEALADAISELIEDRSRAAAMGERGRAGAEKYSIRRTAACTLSFYCGLERVTRGG
jgi:glycosyltransferase involved in cell wall biosynthesis